MSILRKNLSSEKTPDPIIVASEESPPPLVSQVSRGFRNPAQAVVSDLPEPSGLLPSADAPANLHDKREQGQSHYENLLGVLQTLQQFGLSRGNDSLTRELSEDLTLYYVEDVDGSKKGISLLEAIARKTNGDTNVKQMLALSDGSKDLELDELLSFVSATNKTFKFTEKSAVDLLNAASIPVLEANPDNQHSGKNTVKKPIYHILQPVVEMKNAVMPDGTTQAILWPVRDKDGQTIVKAPEYEPTYLEVDVNIQFIKNYRCT